MTDLGTGREEPAPIETAPDGWRLIVHDCASRAMLRIYWPLGGGA